MATAISGLGEPFERLARIRRASTRRRWPLSDVYEFTIEHTRISPAAIHRRAFFLYHFGPLWVRGLLAFLAFGAVFGLLALRII